MITFGLVITSLVALAAANPVARNMVVHEQRSSVPRGFVQKGDAHADTQIQLRIALVQSDMAGLEAELYAVSDPKSQRYGQHLSKAEVEEYVRPSAETVSKVTEWLSGAGLTPKTISPAGDWLSVVVEVSKANELLDADFKTFYNAETDIETIRTMSYSIPASLKGFVDLVHPTISFPGPDRKVKVTSTVVEQVKPDATVPKSCKTSITPACIQDIYGVPATKATENTNILGVTGYIGQWPNDADLQSFLDDFRTDIKDTTTFDLKEIDGGKDVQTKLLAGTEADLDVEYTIGVATGVPVQFISVGNQFQDGALEGFLDTVNFVLSESDPPNVLTTSYGQDEDTISQALAVQLCNAYMQLGARGTSVLFASGDSGVGASSGSCTTFVPQFPSGCPYMTSVGATQYGSSETAAALSSGGFSNYFGVPSYQSADVSSFISGLGNTYSGLYNKSGRGYPDIAAFGEDVVIISKGIKQRVGGTSCASPIWSSVIALLNDKLIAAGKSPMGFLNPWLYSTGASALNDITSGDNPGCSTNGFTAGKGWDPVTGLGSPNWSKLLSALGL